MSRSVKFLFGACAVFVGVAALIWTLNTRDEENIKTPQAVVPWVPNDTMVQRGAYLARAGNCMTCHTARGGQAYAGGRGIDTPFGAIYTSNLTPDEKTGIGSWSPAHFWRAMHNGRSKSGRLLYPAFPYANYTLVTRDDSDALLAYLKSLAPVEKENLPNALRFPYQSQAALAVWRALYFSPGVYKPDTSRQAEWNRGAYLVNGLGHCSACHTARNALGASTGQNLAGGLIPVQNWYAPSLVSPHEAGVGGSEGERVEWVNLLKNGVSAHAVVNGPMTEVVLGSTQYLSAEDLSAVALFVQDLPKSSVATDKPPGNDLSVMALTPSVQVPTAPVDIKGAKLYEQHCAQCHGANGKGQQIGAVNAYPALAGNRAVLSAQTVNLVQIVLNGGYAPATSGNPRPFGMPPFVLVLNDNEVAAILTHIRGAWGNRANAVTPLEVNRIRSNQAK